MAIRFNLEKAVASWRRPLEHTRAFLADDIDELEVHLRDHIDRLVGDGLDEEAAFRRASRRLGVVFELEPEYRKVRWVKHRQRNSLWREVIWEGSMIKNYLTVALRTMRRQKAYTAINIVGLAVGLACCLLIGMYVYHEATYDRFHQHADRTYRVIYNWQRGDQAPPPPRSEFWAWGSAAPGPALATAFPEIEQMVRFSGGHTILLSREGLSFQEEDYYFADSAAFLMFDFELLQGTPETVLDEPDTIVLTETTARKYFGDTDPVGQILTQDNEIPLRVTGIMADLPSNTHFKIDMLLSISTFERRAQDYKFQSWGYVDFFTYVLLSEGHDLDALRAQMPAFIDRHMDETLLDREATFFIDFEPLPEIYLSPISDRMNIGPEGNAANLRIFSLVGVFILLIACINFMNLATARSMERAREVGVRKVLGSARIVLIQQFLIESVVMAVLAMALAAGLILLAMPFFEQLSGIAFPVYLLTHPVVITLVLALTLLVGLLAGSYPAFVLSNFNPVMVLKGAFKRSKQGILLRKTLVVSQFAISVVLLISTLVVFDQVRFMQNQRLGFAQEQQLVIDFGHDRAVLDQLASLLQTWEAHPAVQSAVATRSIPGGYRPNAGTLIENPDGQMEDQTFQIFEVDFGVVEHLEIDVVAGRAFSPDFPSDTTQALMVNEAAARLYGFVNPSDIVGKRFDQWGKKGQVIGVIKDFHHQSLHQQIAPLSLRFAPRSTRFFLLRTDTRDLRQTLAELEAIWKERVPHRPFLYHFLDASFGAMYRAEERFGSLFGTFAGLALFIACLGLLGTAAYATQQRTKEIGVRKVLGASTSEIIALLCKDILVLVGVAFVVAFPLAYLGLERWLDHFPYRTDINVGLFLLAGGLILLLAFLTVSYQTLRAATAAPVKSLRYE